MSLRERFGIRGGSGVIFLFRCRRKPCLARVSESGFRKILLSKNLDLKILKTDDLRRLESISLDRHCLDNDYATSIAGTRSDVTRKLWKSGDSNPKKSRIRPVA